VTSTPPAGIGEVGNSCKNSKPGPSLTMKKNSRSNDSQRASDQKHPAGWGRLFDRLSQLPPVSWPLRVWNWLWTTVRMLWLCGYAFVAALVVLFLFVLNDQGQDLLRISAEQGMSLWNQMFLLGTAALALILWYTSRLLLGREFESYPLDLANARWRQLWLPRIFGISIPLSVAVGMLLVESELVQTELWILAGIYLLLAALVFLFVKHRRTLLGVDPDSMLAVPVDAMRGWDLFVIWAAGVVALALLIAFMVWPVGLSQWFGAPAIVVFGLAGIVLFGSMVLTYALLAYGQPSATALALTLAVVFGFWIDNHEIRLSPDAPPLSRSAPGDHYENWRQAHPDFTPIASREPMILVAAAGGGIRAAYWTATNLAAMEALPGFGQGLFAISGVSGGSVGAATYTALKRALGPDRPDLLAAKVREVLKQDFLSPVVAGLLFPDLAQRFIPVSIRATDRQRFLELSWEKAIGESIHSEENPFSQAFAALYAGDGGSALPSLLLNATVVDSGRRAIVSNLDISAFTDTVDLLAPELNTRDIRLSAAAGASARFTYVSPAGTLFWSERTSEGGTEKHTMRVVDGGYFENSGAATAMDLLTALQVDHDSLFPILILIRNNPKAPPVCRRAETNTATDLSGDTAFGLAGNLLKEVSAPIRALLNARTARGRLAEVDAARQVEAAGGAVIELPLSTVLKAAEDDQAKLARLKKQAVEPPLGWSLSEDVRVEMDDVLDNRRGGLDGEYAMLKALLKGDIGAYKPCRAR
jgi:hypothetical protein